ncbi:hypothetical protein KY358_02195 [Candidatus Woesearchaeota archaeon]|nr:hypothetical protein [Candidatus Woesearchaeota archaeon]
MSFETSKMKKVILGIAIAILLAFFLGHATSTFYKEPEIEDFCRGIDSVIRVESCDDYDYEPVESRRPYPIPEKLFCSCQEIDKEGTVKCTATNPEYDKCSNQYTDYMEKHNKNSFMILVVLGLISIITGGIFLKKEAVGSGIMGGGVLTIIYAAMRYWDSIQDYARVIILGIALGILVWIGYKKIRK